MVTRTYSRGARPAAVSAQTLFAIALAVVAGLIFAWLFRMVILQKNATPRPADDSVEATVAAANIYDQMEVKSLHVKRVKVDRKRFDSWAKSGKVLLTGSQPVGRVTKVAVRAEEPFFEEDLYPYTYPVSVEKKLDPGWRAVIVTLAAKEAMVQVEDHVDLYCTMSNDAFGPNGNATAEIAKGARVVARFGTTRPGAQPARLDAPREYTLQVTPYRYALIELAKTMGAKFSMAVVPQILSDDSKPIAPTGNDINDPQEQQADRVAAADLATLFGIQSSPNGPGPWEIEKYVGIKNEGKTSYPGYVPPSRGGSPTPPATSPAAGPAGPAKPPQKVVPAAYSPAQPSVRGPARSASFNPSAAMASSSRNFGFRAPVERTYKPEDPKTDCPTCGRK